MLSRSIKSFSENCRVFTEYLEYPDATPLTKDGVKG